MSSYNNRNEQKNISLQYYQSKKKTNNTIFIIYSDFNNFAIKQIVEQLSKKNNVAIACFENFSNKIVRNFQKNEFDMDILYQTTAIWEDIKYYYSGSRNYSIIGVSKASWVAMQILMRRPEIESFICIDPDINNPNHDLSFLVPCPCKGMIIQTQETNDCDLQDFTKKLSTNTSVTVSFEKKTIMTELVESISDFY